MNSSRLVSYNNNQNQYDTIHPFSIKSNFIKKPSLVQWLDITIIGKAFLKNLFFTIESIKTNFMEYICRITIFCLPAKQKLDYLFFCYFSINIENGIIF